jgi:hypothetical protein
MAEQSQWEGAPALVTILARIAELYTRAVRVELARQKRDNTHLMSMFERDTPK